VAFVVRRLLEEDERASFRSGNVDLDRFFIKYAGQNQFRHHIGTTYIVIDEEDFIAGYVTITPSEVAPDTTLPIRRRGFPKYPLPVLRLARLAVDERAQSRGIGRLLVCTVLEIALSMGETMGCVGVVVDAKPEAIVFYERLGFVPLDVVAGELGERPIPMTMFLELGAIAKPR
jgi:GNAT superfamily N-acetyltransferase